MSKLVVPSAPEFWAVYRGDTQEVLWFELKESDAEAKARAFASLPEYKDIPIGYALCKPPEETNVQPN